MDSLEMIARCAEVATRYHVFEAKDVKNEFRKDGVTPFWCKLRPMDIQWNEMCNTLGVVRKMVKDLGEVIECGCRQ